jgi:hypothetical protein
VRDRETGGREANLICSNDFGESFLFTEGQTTLSNQQKGSLGRDREAWEDQQL